MRERKLVGTAVVTSFVIHTAGVVAFATWSTYAMNSRAHFAGQRQSIQLVVSVDEPQWSPELEIVASTHPEPPVVIEPKEARIAKRRYVQSPVGDVPLFDFLADGTVEMSPAKRERVRVEDLPEQASHDTEPNPKVLKRRALTTLSPTLARVVPPSSLGDADDTPPDLSRNAPPTYPLIAIQRRWEGTVLLRIQIDETGQVISAEVARTSGYPVLDGAAATAVRRWTGTPAHRGGQPAATVELLPVRFKL